MQRTPITYVPITGKTLVEIGDEFKPCWELYFRRLPPPYGWMVRDAPGAVFRRPVLPPKVRQQLRELI